MDERSRKMDEHKKYVIRKIDEQSRIMDERKKYINRKMDEQKEFMNGKLYTQFEELNWDMKEQIQHFDTKVEGSLGLCEVLDEIGGINMAASSSRGCTEGEKTVCDPLFLKWKLRVKRMRGKMSVGNRKQKKTW